MKAVVADLPILRLDDGCILMIMLRIERAAFKDPFCSADPAHLFSHRDLVVIDPLLKVESVRVIAVIGLRGFLLRALVGSVKYLPFASRSGVNAMLQLSGEIEEAAVITGVPWWKRMLRVIFPIQKSSFLSGYLLPLVSCMRELSLFVLLVPTSNTILTTMLMQYSEKGWAQFGNAINLLIIIVVLLVNFIVNKLTGASIDKGVGG
jgi:ABC-type Fe3+ transport system permease subunit